MLPLFSHEFVNLNTIFLLILGAHHFQRVILCIKFKNKSYITIFHNLSFVHLLQLPRRHEPVYIGLLLYA